MPARPVSVVIEPGEGYTELSIGLPIQCDFHRVGGAEVRLGLDPAMDARVHMVRQRDGADG